MPRPSSTRVAPVRAPIPIDRSRPTAVQIYASLRSSIVSLSIEPGEPISESEVALAAGVSRTPVREALSRLEGERLVAILPSRGTIVTQIDASVVRQAIRIRQLLEGDVAAECARRLPAELVPRMEGALAMHRQALAANDLAAAYVEDQRFHYAMFDVFGYDMLWAQVVQARLQMERVRNLMVRHQRSRTNAVEFHTRILEAIIDRDAERARRVMSEHIDANRDFIDELEHSAHPFLARPQAVVAI